MLEDQSSSKRSWGLNLGSQDLAFEGNQRGQSWGDLTQAMGGREQEEGL